jgi:hypothetical protein
MNTYEVKQSIDNTNFIEMTTPEGIVSFVPMVDGNSDYQRYLNPEAEQSTPILP